MRKAKRLARPEVETLDRRELLSGVVPTITMEQLGRATHGLRNVMGTLARTHDYGAAERRLDAIAGEIPHGRLDLVPAWQGRLDAIDPSIPGSGLAVQNQMIRDLWRNVYAQAQAGEIRVVGRGSAAFNTPIPANYYRVEIVNMTGRQITATTFLNVAQSGRRPTIGPQTIPAEAGANFFVFNFGIKAPPARSISLEINATGTIHKFPEQPLVEPYGGAKFYITTLGDYFVISKAPPTADS